MISIKALISAARTRYADAVSVRYANGVMFVLVEADAFYPLGEDERLIAFASESGLDEEDLREVLSGAEVSLILATADEMASMYGVLRDSELGGHWLPLFDEVSRDAWSVAKRAQVSDCTAIHFYGFKGGQARSTVLCMFAKSLAASGFKVLLVDADIEAPSLHLMLGVSSSTLGSSLMGICGRQAHVEPMAYVRTANNGAIDLISTYPLINDFEVDVASFVVRSGMDSTMLERGAARIAAFASGEGGGLGIARYDYLIFDHRTGLSASVLPIIGACPGSVVINVRPDGLSENQDSVIDALLSANPASPGAFVSFSLDPEKRKGSIAEHEAKLQDQLLYKMADAIARGAEDASAEELDGFLSEYFVSWFHDRSFLGGGIPELPELSRDNLDSLGQLRRVLGVPLRPAESTAEDQGHSSADVEVSSPSGAQDTGWFVETPDAARLLQPSLSSFYVYGRKGTGKTRLLAELVKRGLGRALHAANDFEGGGLRAQTTVELELLRLVGDDFEQFWWATFTADLLGAISGRSLETELQELIALGLTGLRSTATPTKAAQLLSSIGGRHVVLIDGVETAVSANLTLKFVEGLFRFLSTLQNDSLFRENVRFRVFIRSDLPVGLQNVEQQVHNRKLDLRWDESSIFHYVLAEIARSEWFISAFPSVCDDIDSQRMLVRTGGLRQDEYEKLLLRVFPQKLRRNNLSTMTFLRTYFSDAAGEGDSRSSFYPRVFGRFLTKVGELGQARQQKALDTDQRVAHDVVLEAFEYAAREFINEVQQELNFALNISSDLTRNGAHVNELLESFRGMPTPFELDRCVATLSEKLPDPFAPKVVRDCLRRMKNMGIFEDHPSDSNKWRAGRLFKEGLRMKYVR